MKDPQHSKERDAGVRLGLIAPYHTRPLKIRGHTIFRCTREKCLAETCLLPHNGLDAGPRTGAPFVNGFL